MIEVLVYHKWII